MRQFTIRDDVAANIRELRSFLGSIAKPLSRDDLAKEIAARHPRKPRLNGTTIQRWEEGTEPDFIATAIMAGLAGVEFELFALGRVYRRTDADTGESEIIEGPARGGPDTRPAHIRLAEKSGAAYLSKVNEVVPDVAKPDVEKRKAASGGKGPAKRRPKKK